MLLYCSLGILLIYLSLFFSPVFAGLSPTFLGKRLREDLFGGNLSAGCDCIMPTIFCCCVIETANVYIQLPFPQAS
jgi:hypothetical protein